MSNTLLIRDETFQGTCIRQQHLELEGEKASIREIIAARVMLEVATYNQKAGKVFEGLIEAHPVERALNRTKARKKALTIDPEEQVYLAWEAFNRNRYFVLVNSVQAESLDEVVPFHTNTVVSFLKLTPLVGG
ncbi:MAG: hypothetical protein AAFP02_14855 [Bacteroidota bacterium]